MLIFNELGQQALKAEDRPLYIKSEWEPPNLDAKIQKKEKKLTICVY